jgi:GT2 family glycosyltransferase
MKKSVSIILPLYDLTLHARKMTCCCIDAIKQYTDPKDFELIIVDNRPRFKDSVPENDRNWTWNWLYDHLDYIGHCEEKVIENKVDPGNYIAMNQGAAAAEGDYLVFFESDVYIHRNWLPDLKYYLDNNLCDAIIPDQLNHTYEFREGTYSKSYEDCFVSGMIDQCMLMMKKDVFNTIGGWDERFFRVLGWKAFQERMGKHGFSIGSTLKVPITHITFGTQDLVNSYSDDKIDYMDEEAKILNDPNFDAAKPNVGGYWENKEPK